MWSSLTTPTSCRLLYRWTDRLDCRLVLTKEEFLSLSVGQKWERRQSKDLHNAGQLLHLILPWKQRVTCVQLRQYTAQTPHVYRHTVWYSWREGGGRREEGGREREREGRGKKRERGKKWKKSDLHVHVHAVLIHDCTCMYVHGIYMLWCTYVLLWHNYTYMYMYMYMCIHVQYYKVRLEPGVWNSDTTCTCYLALRTWFFMYMTQASRMTEHMMLVWHHMILVWHPITLVWYDSGCIYIYTHPGWPQESGRIWTGCTCTHARAHSNWNQSLSPWLNSDLLIAAEYSPAGRQRTFQVWCTVTCTYSVLTSIITGFSPHLFRAASAASLYSLVQSN